MCLGCIPIVKSSSLDLLYKDMPIIILKDWNEINIDKLNLISKDVIKVSREKLLLKYWCDLINSYIPKKGITELNIACCLSVRNCGKYLPQIFKNLQNLSNLFKNCYFIFVYDNCKDNTEEILKSFQEKYKKNFIIKKIENTSKYRTIRIRYS